MANSSGSIDEIIGQEAIKGVDITTQKMESLYKVFIQNIAVINTMNVALGDVKKIDELEKAIAGIQQKTIGLAKVTKEYTQTQASAAVERQRQIAQMKGIAKETSDNIGAYERLNAQHKRTEKQAKDVGIQLGIESDQFKKLSAEALKYRDALAKVEQSTGNMTRITGNYRNQTFQLSQVIREMPAFMYSASTGILALSNNLPMLGDAFADVSKQIGADGKKVGVVGALGIFGKSLLSLPNVFAIAIGLFTIFSKEIFEFVKGTNKSITATKDFSKALEDSSKSISSEIVAMDKLYKSATNTNLTYQERKNAVDELQKLYPSYFKNIEDEIILAGEAKTAYEDLTKALINKSIVGAFDEQASELASKLPKLYKELDRLNKLKQQALSSAPPTTSTFSSGVPMGVQTAVNSPLAGIDASIDKTTKDIEALRTAMESLYKLASDFSSKIDVTDTSKGGKTPKTPKVKEKDIIKVWTPKYETRTFELDQSKGSITPETKQAVQKNLDEIIKIAKEQMKANPIGFTWSAWEELEVWATKASEFIKSWEKEFNDIGNAINQVSQVNTDKELVALDQREKALKSYYDNELRFIEESGMSTGKKEREKRKLEAETEAKRKQIDRDRITALRKQAQTEKAVNIANIIETTALAIITAFKEGDPYTKALRAGIAAATGAASLYSAINAPLPQYAKGRRGGKAEFAETNEQGAELHITKDGKAYIPNEGKRGITYLDEGTSVLPADITKQLVSSTIIQIANNQAIKTNDLQRAILEKTDREIIEIIGLRKDLREKNLSATFNNYTGFEAWKNTYIR